MIFLPTEPCGQALSLVVKPFQVFFIIHWPLYGAGLVVGFCWVPMLNGSFNALGMGNENWVVIVQPLLPHVPNLLFMLLSSFIVPLAPLCGPMREILSCPAPFYRGKHEGLCVASVKQNLAIQLLVGCFYLIVVLCFLPLPTHTHTHTDTCMKKFGTSLICGLSYITYVLHFD